MFIPESHRIRRTDVRICSYKHSSKN